MKVFIAEDNELELTYFNNMISKETDLTVVGQATEGNKALKLINLLKPDVVFLDIAMPGLSGIEISKTIDKNIKVVFITAHNEYAVDAFEIGAFDYILKPIDEERFQISLKRLRESWGLSGMEKLPIKVDNETVFLDINDIILIEKIKGLRKVAIDTRKASFITKNNLNILESKLNKFGFIRTHKSFIVNPNKIEKLIPFGDKSYLVKLSGTTKNVILSRKYASEIKHLLINLL